MSKKSWETPHLMLSCIWGKELLNYRETAKVSIFITRLPNKKNVITVVIK